MTVLTPQETLQAIIDGKVVEVKFSEQHDWETVLTAHMNINELIDTKHHFRLAPETITIGDVSFPKPESKKPKKGTKYFYPNIVRNGLVDSYEWEEHSSDFKILKSGMLHLSKENAIAHAKALIKLSGGNVDE